MAARAPGARGRCEQSGSNRCPSPQPRQDEGREIRTPNLLIWSQTRCRCAMPPLITLAKLLIQEKQSDLNKKSSIDPEGPSELLRSRFADCTSVEDCCKQNEAIDPEEHCCAASRFADIANHPIKMKGLTLKGSLNCHAADLQIANQLNTAAQSASRMKPLTPEEPSILLRSKLARNRFALHSGNLLRSSFFHR